MRNNDRVTSATRQPEPPAAVLRPRLIATDLDGTLLRDDKSVSPRTVAALAAAEKAGIEVFFVTGRPARWMDVVSAHVHGHGLAICGNGAAVVDLHGGPGAHRFVKVRELAPENALDAVRLLREAAPGTVYAVEQTYGFHQEPAYPKLHMEVPDDLLPAEEILAPGGRAATEPILKILAFHPSWTPTASSPSPASPSATAPTSPGPAPAPSWRSAVRTSPRPAPSRCAAPSGASRARRSSPSVTCPTTSRCSPGRDGRTPWATRIRT